MIGPIEDWIIQVRREFHRYPEISFREYETQKRILKILGELGIKAQKIADTGVMASIRGTRPGPCIALRADTDALAVQEEPESRKQDYISINDGAMHACGHDGHMAMVLGAARLLLRERDFPGEVRLIFQPAEEIPPGGAARVIAEGGLLGVDAILGMHIFTSHEVGSVGFCPGPFMANSNKFWARLVGKGGHHSNPEKCIDPVRMAADFILSLSSALEVNLDPKKYVIGFGKVEGGVQFNRTPDSVEVLGSYRTFDPEVMEIIDLTIKTALEEVMKKYEKKGNEAFLGLPSYELEILHGFPILVNDPEFTEAASSRLKESFPKLTVYGQMKPTFAAEDFAYYLQEVPGIFISLGNRNPKKGVVEINHSSRFDIDEAILPKGAAILKDLALDFLHSPKKYLGERFYDHPGI